MKASDNSEPPAGQTPLFRKIDPSLLIGAGICVAALALLLTVPYYLGYTDARQSIAAYLPQAWSMEQWQHCWLVLPAIAFIVYQQRASLSSLPLKGSWLGLPAMGFGLLFYFVGFRVDNVYFGYAAIQILIPSTILWLVGWQVFWKLAFPVAFLVFAWPLFFLEERITFPLRVVMSNASAFVLNGLGIDVVRQGTGLISAPDPQLGVPAGARFSVDVADPCSGIRSLFALMMVSALYGHFTLKTWWQKWVLFLCSIPLAVAGNLVRILTLTLGTIAFGADFAIGKHALTDPSWFHMGAGYLVFAVALGGMVIIGWLLGNASELPTMVRGLIAKARKAAKEVPEPQPIDAAPAAGSSLPAKRSYRDEY